MRLLFYLSFTLLLVALRCGQVVSVKCYHCTQEQALVPHGFVYNVLGCEHPKVKTKTRECPVACRQQIYFAESKPVEVRIANPNKMGNITMKPGAIRYRGCEEHAGLAGTCRVNGNKRKYYYDCFCSQDLCNGQPPPCSWMRNANPEDLHPVGCIEDDEDGMGMEVSGKTAPPGGSDESESEEEDENGHLKPKSKIGGSAKADVEVSGGADVSGQPDLHNDQHHDHEHHANSEGAVHCHKCTPEEAFKNAQDIYGLADGCEAPDVRGKSKHCKAACKVQILRQNVQKGKISRYTGDAVLRDCEDKAGLAGTCKVVNDTMYECYCEHDMCNGNPPPCAWIIKANPKDKYPTGCMRNDEDDYEWELMKREQATERPKKGKTTVAPKGKSGAKGGIGGGLGGKGGLGGSGGIGGGGGADTAGAEEGGLSCYKCSKTEAFRMKDGTKDNPMGCEETEIKAQTKQCPASVCKQQILRLPQNEDVLKGGGIKDKHVVVTRYPGDAFLRGCGNDSKLTGSCKLVGNFAYECYCSQPLCNGMPPPCSWIRKANPKDKQPSGCIEDDDDGINELPHNEVVPEADEAEPTTHKPKAKGKVGADVDASAGGKGKKGGKAETEDVQTTKKVSRTTTAAPIPAAKNKKAEKPAEKVVEVEEPVEEEGLTCYKCTKTEAYRKHNGTQANAMGCEDPEIKVQTRKCPFLCRQQVLRIAQNEDVLKTAGSITEAHVVVTRYPGDIWVRGCGNDTASSTAGACKMVGNNVYECYCSHSLCNGMPPPCSWIRKANPKDTQPQGCVEDEDDELDGPIDPNVPVDEPTPEDYEPLTQPPPTTKKPVKLLITKPTTTAAPRTVKPTTKPVVKSTPKPTSKPVSKKPPTTPEPLPENGVKCFRCTKTEAFRSNNGTEPNLGGCEAPEFREKTRICPGICKQQIFRITQTESIPAEKGSKKHVTVTRYPGDALLRGCSNDTHLAGSCKVVGNLTYECYCSQHLCNSLAPPCSWMRRANPEDEHPVGCIEDDDNDMGAFTDEIAEVPEEEVEQAVEANRGKQQQSGAVGANKNAQGGNIVKGTSGGGKAGAGGGSGFGGGTGGKAGTSGASGFGGNAGGNNAACANKDAKTATQEKLAQLQEEMGEMKESIAEIKQEFSEVKDLLTIIKEHIISNKSKKQ